MEYNLIDCFNLNRKFWNFLGISINPNDMFRFYKVYSIIFVFFFFIVYNALSTINLYFLPSQLDIVIEELIFIFMEFSVVSKVVTFLVMPENIAEVITSLQSPIFQPNNAKEAKILDDAKRFINKYWKIVAVISVISNFTHVSSPMITHLLVNNTLELPVCSYSFLSANIIQQYIYPLYLYQSVGMHFHVWYNLNIDTLFLGVMILIIAQLKILDLKLRAVTEPKEFEIIDDNNAEEDPVIKLNKCIIHYDAVAKYCNQVEDVFSATLFTQFGLASCIICVCLFRFTLPAPFEYFIFLVTYITVMTVQIFVPCWFGTRIIDKSTLLTLAVYNCDWTPRSRQFKSNLRLLVERANRPLSITGGKMFSLSLATFTSIMNSAYSFFTLLRHMQSRQT